VNTKIYNLIILGFSLLLLIGEWGCAHHAIPPSPLPESMQQQLGKIGVIARATEEQQPLGSPGTGRLSNIGKGASLGALMGANAGAQGGMMAPFAIPALAALGLVGGAIIGGVRSEPWQEPDTAFRAIVAELNLNRILPEQLVAFSRSHGYEIAHLIAGPPEEPQKQFRYAAARRDGIDTVLEIQDLTVNLFPAEYMVNPDRALNLAAHLQLIRTADGTVLDDRVVMDELGPALELNVWLANQAARFRQEVQHASERLAEKIVTEYFMVYHFPEQFVQGDFGLNIYLKGLTPKQPAEMARTPNAWSKLDEDIQNKYAIRRLPEAALSLPVLPVPFEFLALAQRSDSFQPTLSWEPFPGTSVTYDLRIWQAGRWGPETLVYDRTNLKQSSHKLEVTLDPSTAYYWSVRAHFSEQGKERITEWSRHSASYSQLMKVLTWGFAAIADPVQDRFYVFITPSLESMALKRLASPSPEEVSCPWLHPDDPLWESAVVIKSLKPLLRWDPFPGPGEEVTYDITVWPVETGLREVRLGPIAYERQWLTEPSHHMESTLDTAAYYVWAVRARYRLNDQILMTSWSHKIATGTSAEPHYCQFWTPSSLSFVNAPESPVTHSQWFPWGNWPLSPPDSERQEQSTK